MFKKQIYPKTKRIGNPKPIVVTEKLDGSNLCFFKKDDELYIAQRNNVYSLTEAMENNGEPCTYKGLYAWLMDYGTTLKEMLQPNAVICGEWLGMGKIAYPKDEFPARFYMFAKANIDDDFNIYNLYYDHTLFIYSFINQEFPYFISLVPVVVHLHEAVTIPQLDILYEKYTELHKNRNIEGFIINDDNTIHKYVRFKNGVLTPHKI